MGGLGLVEHLPLHLQLRVHPEAGGELLAHGHQRHRHAADEVGALVHGGLAGQQHVSALVFFFQAEDGIRDYKVTGVQTCALPISSSTPGGATARPTGPRSTRAAGSITSGSRRPSPTAWPASGSPGKRAAGRSPRTTRSEERRVGKECKSRWAAYD